MSSILPSLFPMCHDEHKRVPMHHHDFKEFLAVANKIQTEKKGPESIILFCNILSFLQGCANDGKWDAELDQLLLNTMRCIMSLMTEENITSIQTIYHRGAAKPIASLCSFFLTTRCRLRRSGPLQKECLTLLASALELLLVQGWNRSFIHSFIHSFIP